MNKMLWQQVFMGLVGLSSGLLVAGGLFALMIALGLISNFAGKTHTAEKILCYEDAIALGGIIGNLIFIYGISLPIGEIGVALFGIFTGIFVGAWAMTLTEIINIIPIVSRRLQLQKNLQKIIITMAIGRAIGSLFFYYQRW